MSAAINWPNFLLLVFVIFVFGAIHCALSAVEHYYWDRKQRRTFFSEPRGNGYWIASAVFVALAVITCTLIGMVEHG